MKSRRFSNIIWGLILLLIATGLVLSKFDVPGMGIFESVSLWKILVGVGLVFIFIESVGKRSYFGAMFSLAFLGIVFDKQLHIEVLVPWTILVVALLVSIALNLIFGNKKNCNRNRNSNCNNNNNKHNHSNSSSGFRSSSDSDRASNGESVDGERVFQKVTFGAATRYVNSLNLQYAEITCWYGGIEIYFDNAKVPSGQATINVSSNFSGVEIYIPKEWKVINEITSFCGGVDMDDNWTGDESVVITLTGHNNFGGVEIIRI